MAVGILFVSTLHLVMELCSGFTIAPLSSGSHYSGPGDGLDNLCQYNTIFIFTRQHLQWMSGIILDIVCFLPNSQEPMRMMFGQVVSVGIQLFFCGSTFYMRALPLLMLNPYTHLSPFLLVTLLRAEYGQTLAKGVRLLGKSTGSYGKPKTTRVSLVLRWTSKLGCCLTTTVQEGLL